METGEGWFYHENIGVLWDFTMKKGETWGPKTILTIKNGIQGREGGVELRKVGIEGSSIF